MELIEVKDVKTRKAHQCFLCKEVCPKGTKMTVCKTADMGSVSNTYYCDVCEQILWASGYIYDFNNDVPIYAMELIKDYLGFYGTKEELLDYLYTYNATLCS